MDRDKILCIDKVDTESLEMPLPEDSEICTDAGVGYIFLPTGNTMHDPFISIEQ